LLSRAEQILEFWFGDCDDRTVLKPGSERVKRWFDGNDEFDCEIREKFTPDLRQAEQGKLNAWKQTPRGLLALVTVLDQFARHIHRGHPWAYKNDPKALKIVEQAIEKGTDKSLRLFERAFFYLPLMHSEDPQVQEKSRRAYAELAAAAAAKLPEKNRAFYVETHHNAVQQYQLIRRFGRYPYRNRALGRPSTPEEYNYLQKVGQFF